MICHKVLAHLAFSIDLLTMITGYTGKGGHNGMQTQDSLNFGRVGAVVKLAKKEKQKTKTEGTSSSLLSTKIQFARPWYIHLA